ncbi:hypothetical protein [Salirhabdus sp. Marseille-P4669]|uniref:hypothetical protein n=1 Tax=Salirhabdus sp. Marseille-P4669 TaxID=2042310 RepID=UPI000C7AD190|nr:hypothetical protein [Salirhabdus sp. Marseille-P4669]
MSQNQNDSSGKQKLSMQEIVKQQLERKKQAQQNGNKHGRDNGNHMMKSQHVKKTTNTRRKMGS